MARVITACMKPFSNERAEPPPQRPGMNLFPNFPITQSQPFFNRGPPPNNILPPPYGGPNQNSTAMSKAQKTDTQSMMKNDYCQNFIDTGERPQNFIRDILLEERFADYPKLNELIKIKDNYIRKRSTLPFYVKADLRELKLAELGKFDVILMDPPWEEYHRRAKQFFSTEKLDDPWTLDQIAELPIDEISDNPSFLFLWVGNEGLEEGRALFKKWGFKRCEDIVWLKTNKTVQKDARLAVKNSKILDTSSTLQRVKEHCLVGLKGDIKRTSDSYFIHANIDTDVIVDEEPPNGSTEKPKEIYQIIERFCLGRKRLELFGSKENIRPGWLTVGTNLPGTNFDYNTYHSLFETDRYLGTTNEIENLRPKSPKSSQRDEALPKSQGAGLGNTNMSPFLNQQSQTQLSRGMNQPQNNLLGPQFFSPFNSNPNNGGSM